MRTFGGNDSNLRPLGGERRDALRSGDQVQEENLLFLYAML